MPPIAPHAKRGGVAVIDLDLVRIPLPRALLSGPIAMFTMFVLTPALVIAAYWLGVPL